MMETYKYPIKKGPKAGPVDEIRLVLQARALPFAGELIDLQRAGPELSFRFGRKLTAAEKKKLDHVVDAHDGRPRHGVSVGELPASAAEGQLAYAADGRKAGEEAGEGTGIPVYWSDGAWRRYRDDKPVTA
jgi:hypothetical protein